MSDRRLLKFIGAYTVLGFVPLAVGFFLLPVYTAYLPPSEFGVLTAANVSQTFATLAITLGLDAALGRFYFDYLEDELGRRRLLSTIAYSMIALCMVLALLAIPFGDLLFRLVWKGLPFRPYGWWVLIGALTQVLYSLAFTWYRNGEHLRATMAVSLATTAASAIGTVVALVWVRPDALAAFVGKTLGTVVAVVPFTLILLARGPFGIDRPLLRKLFDYALPLVAYTVVAYALFNGDRVLMQRWFDLRTLGLYALAATLVSPMEIVLQSGQQAVQPSFYRAMEHREADISQRLGSFYVMLTLLNIGALVGLMSAAPLLLRLFRGAKYVGSEYFVAVLAFSQLFRTQYNAYAFSLFQSKHTRVLPVVTVVALVVGAAAAAVTAKPLGPLSIGLGVVAWKYAQRVATGFAIRRIGSEATQVDIRASDPWVAAAAAYVVGYYVMVRVAPGLALAYVAAVGVPLLASSVYVATRYARGAGLLGRPTAAVADDAPTT